MKSLMPKQSSVTNTKSRVITKKTMSSSEGMSLIEVVVALALLAVIMFFMSSTQLSSIKMNHKTKIIRDLTHSAEREMENRRQDPQLSTVITSSQPDCFLEDEGYSCKTSIHPCSIGENDGEATIVCVDTTDVNFTEAEAVAHQITVDMETEPDARSGHVRNIRLQTIVQATKATP